MRWRKETTAICVLFFIFFEQDYSCFGLGTNISLFKKSLMDKNSVFSLFIFCLTKKRIKKVKTPFLFLENVHLFLSCVFQLAAPERLHCPPLRKDWFYYEIQKMSRKLLMTIFLKLLSAYSYEKENGSY